MAFSSGYDMSNDYKFDDGLGKFYAIVAGIWTTILVCGAAFLVNHRNLPSMRIRNIPLAISAVATLHVYWVLCMIAYGLNGHWPCNAEFWIMNIYLPLGIALFHASNSQLLFTAGQQEKFTNPDYMTIEKLKARSQDSGWKKHLGSLKAERAMKATMHSIAMGIIAQFIVSIVVFFLSKRFQPQYGIIGEDITGYNLEDSRKLCRHGFEWLPSIFWQFFWAWIYAPYMLWRVRRIKDVHGWRVQTIVCCLAGLPASPMWLLALYLPQMENVDRYFIPPLWFSPSIFLMELFMIFTPCWQLLKNRKLKKETLEIIAEWEQHKIGSSLESNSTRIGAFSSLSQRPSMTSSSSSRKGQSHLYTMTAMEKALQTNSTPLLLFAALKDFSGENISFLNAVRDWKNAWTSTPRPNVLRSTASSFSRSNEIRRYQFNKAIEIYSSFVSLKYSTYPINISSQHLKELEIIFEAPAAITIGSSSKSSSVTPFGDYWDGARIESIEMHPGKRDRSDIATISGDDISEFMPSGSSSHHTSIVESYKMKNLAHKIPRETVIPTIFDQNVFDEAVDSIKYTVLTNTWPKFVSAGYTANSEPSSTMDRLQERVMECRTGFARLLSV